MLVRAAGRKQRRQASLRLTTDFQQLYLPFLCPAQLRWSASRSTSPPARLPVPHVQHVDRRQARNLASVATATDYAHHDSDRIHVAEQRNPNLFWDYGQKSPRQASQHSQYLILKHDREEPATLPRYNRGIGGTSSDMLQNVYTCLRVNRFERVEMIVERMAARDDVTNEELAHAHQAYLGARYDAIHAPPGVAKNWQAMSRWFEKEVASRDFAASRSIYVVMIKAAMVALQGEERDQIVLTYSNMSGLSHSELLDDPTLDAPEVGLFSAILEDRVPAYDMEIGDQKMLVASEDELLIGSRYELDQADIPEILSVKQKGAGLSSLKEVLDAFQKDVQKPALADIADYDEAKLRAYERERMIEESAAAVAVKRWKVEDEHLRALGITGNLQSRSLSALMWQWYSALLPIINEEMAQIRSVLNGKAKKMGEEDRKLYGAHLESIPAETIAANVIIFIMSMVARGKDKESGFFSAPLRISMLTTSLGRQMEEESNASHAIKRHMKEKNQSTGGFRKAYDRSRKSKQATSDGIPNLVSWPTAIKTKIGAMLVTKLVDAAQMPVTRIHPRTKQKVTQMQPAFFHKTVYRMGKKQGYIVPSNALIEKLHREPVGGLICKRLPMVVEPLPWTGFSQGGYLNYETPFMRFPPSDQTPKDYAMAAIDKGDMDKVFEALNVLSSIPWKINEDILRVQIDAWNTGKAIGNLAPLEPQVEIPPEPEASADPDVRKRWLSGIKEMERKKSGLHAQRCYQNFQLEIARSFRNETLYFPHNIDFRGRAYPVPPYLNHMGADNARALMKFQTGKELGERGLRWLKIHLANVFGYDKASLQEREDFAMKHLDDVYDSANHPLEGRQWWLQSEDAWQTLAACFELKAALETPDPTKFVSTLPIHQDGTCNGLQHYAALGGDEVGARQVNLEPGDRPADVYTAVADAVKAEVEMDYQAGNPIAKMLHGRITRKVVKQPVMTNVYGVTYYGAKDQVKKRIEEIFPNLQRSDIINPGTLAAYVARKIFKSLGEMFRGAQAIQEWLGKSADRITTCVTAEQIETLRKGQPDNTIKSKKGRPTNKPKPKNDKYEVKALFKSSVIWTTPLRLPVVQPYRTSTRTLVTTSLQRIALQEPRAWDPVSKRKQLQGFPPNFIHSLDATHMMLSALKCDEKGITFASIHDSFWTHACDIDDLGELLRDAFVHMHSENVIGRLRQELEARYTGSMYMATVDARSRIGKKIKKALKTAGAKPRDDVPGMANLKVSDPRYGLLLESERLRLLESTDAEEEARGKEMITPGSIFAAEADESAFTVPNDITDSKLGNLPGDPDAGQDQGDLSGKAADSEMAEEEDEAVAAEVNEDDVDEDVDDDVDEDDEGDEEDDTDEPDVIADDDMRTDKEIRSDLLDTGEISATKAGRSGKAASKPKKMWPSKINVWLPLTFPPVPEKGSFDVTRLKQSRYFFH